MKGGHGCVLEQFGFPYHRLKDDDVTGGDLRQRFDVLILPSDATNSIVGKADKDEADADASKEFEVPPAYRSGIGKEGVTAIKQFVEEGGTLLALNEACAFAIEKLDLQVSNTLTGKSSKSFFCPGSTLKASVDTTHPLGYGMPDETLILFWDSPAFEIQHSRFSERYALVVQYPERDIFAKRLACWRRPPRGTGGYGLGAVWRGTCHPFRISTAVPCTNPRDV